ncbi:hypothetical protein MASR1M49_11420 [Pararhodobacter aggregans]
MMPPNYTRAWAETDIVLHTVLGLVIALDDIVSQSDAIPPDGVDDVTAPRRHRCAKVGLR